MDLHLKVLFDRFQEQFGSGPGLGPGSGACLMKVEGISPNFVKSIFRAAAALYRTEPWKRLCPGHFFGVRIGKDSDWSGKKQPFPCAQFIGGDGGDVGFYMFRSENDAKKMTGSRETVRVPNVELLRVTYEVDTLMFPSNRKMIRSFALEGSGNDRFPVIDVARCNASGDLRFRNPNVEELRFVCAFMRAISMVHPLLQVEREEGSCLVVFEPFIETVDVQWPSEMAKGNGNGNDLVAVTISHPPGQSYEDKASSTASSTPTKYAEPPREEFFTDVRVSSKSGSRQCAMCEKDANNDQSLCCGRCRAIVYCGPDCQKQHWKSHKTMCGLYKAMMEREEELAMKIFLFPCVAEQPCKWLESLHIHQKGMWRRKCSCYSHCPYGLLPVKGGLWDSWGGLDDEEYPRDSPFHNRDGISSPILLSGWSEYYSLRALPLSSPVADILSHPLSVYYILTALSISSKNLLLKGKEVIVHYLGPEGELDWMPAFAEISHLLNGHGNIQIVMVGPEVPTNLSGTTSGISSRVRVNLVRGFYQEEAPYLPSPHIVVALNCEFDRYASWGGALDLIKAMGIPAFFTEQSELSCTNTKQVLRGAGLQITHPVTPNPFRSPVKNSAATSNLPAYSNGFLLGVNT